MYSVNTLEIMAKPTGLDALRLNIDAIDDEIHSLLLRRTDLVTQIGNLKRASNREGFSLRPSREATIIRRLVAHHSGPFPVGALVRLWRELLSGQVMVQNDFNIALFDPSTEATYRHITRDQFSASGRVHLLPSPAQVIHAVASGNSAVGVLPLPSDKHPDPWWATLPDGGDIPLRIIARLPFLKEKRDAAAQSEALVVARVTPEPSGEDVSLVVVGLSEHTGDKELEKLLRAQNLVATTLSRSTNHDHLGHSLYFLAIEGFVQQDALPITNFLRSAAKVVTQVTVVGSYAKQLYIDN